MAAHHPSTQVRRIPISVLVALLLAASLLAVAAPRQQVRAADVWTIHGFPTQERVIVLTFDAGADRGHAAWILDTLRSKGVRATFGMTGVWARDNPDLILRIRDEGHHLINHSWSHPSFPTISSAQRAQELKRTEDVVRQIAGVDLRPWFRPPYGEYNQSVLNDLAANGYTINLMWTIDTLGWRGISPAAINQRVMAGASPGGVVLMHVGAGSQDAAALPSMIDQLRARGYSFATASQLAGLDERHFPETGFTVSGNFLRYWNQFGGLAVFGYPISDVFERDGLRMQYFERVRMELHPGAWPQRYDILLGRLGADMTAGRENEPPFRPVAGGSNPNCDYYPETGHWLCWGFRGYWHRNGGLAIFGYPISEEFRENGYTVQYFERARFEWHPENQPPWDILGGLIGRWAMEQGW
jgi:peptidoglycan-N-acetylglucosamine deacetylase